MTTGTTSHIAFTLVIVNCTEVLWACHATWAISCSGETAMTFSNVTLVCRCLSLRMHRQRVLIKCICLQRRNETLMFLDTYLNRSLNWTLSLCLNICSLIHVLEKVSDHGLPHISTRFILHHFKVHGCEHLSSLSIILSISLSFSWLNACWRSIVWADALSYQVVLIRRWHQLLLEVSSTTILVLNFHFLITGNKDLLLANVQHW